MTFIKPLRVAVLIDHPRAPLSGGVVAEWEHIAHAAVETKAPIDLTVYCLGDPTTEAFGDKVRLTQLPPVADSRRLRVLACTPDHTDLARYHRALADELTRYDLLHTTDGSFAFAKTAEKISRKRGIPLTTSFHADVPARAQRHTYVSIKQKFADGLRSRFLLNTLEIDKKQKVRHLKRLERHLSHCSAVFYTNEAEARLARSFIPDDTIKRLRYGVDRAMFGPHRKDRRFTEDLCRISAEHVVVLVAGRLDAGKNIYLLLDAFERLLDEGKPVHLLAAGDGPARMDMESRLGERVTVTGFVPQEELAIYYASADVLALPSDIESRSLTLVEALSSALPVLVSEKGGLAEAFDHTPAIDVVPDDAQSWVEALRAVTGSTNKRAHMSKVAAACAESCFSDWSDVLLQDLLPVWQKVALKGRLR